MMAEHLFVYGSLMRRATGFMGHPQRRRLAREAGYVAEGWTSGRLYNLGSYPGLVDVDVEAAVGARDEVVHGEIWRLRSPDRTLAWLDIYEGVGPGAPSPEFERVRRQVFLASNSQAMRCLLYVYRGPISGRRWIRPGRWVG